jgi:hypothetical protein
MMMMIARMLMIKQTFVIEKIYLLSWMRDFAKKTLIKELVMMIDCMNANEKQLLWMKNLVPWMKLNKWHHVAYLG